MPGTKDPIWQALASHRSRMDQTTMHAMFNEDPERAERYQLSAAGVHLDYSRNLVNDETLNIFSRLIDATALPHRVQQMIEGERINGSEKRRALHTLLRTRRNRVPETLTSEAEEVQAVADRMEEMTNEIRDGVWTGYRDTRIRQVLHIGIGGSYLGPRMIAEALTPLDKGVLKTHYVANVDGHHIDHVLRQIQPEETLVIIVSKTFTTTETLQNANSTRDWLLQKIPEAELGRHLVAVTTNIAAATEFGVLEDNILPMWDWVGGRYSLWSAVGLPIALTYGMRVFRALLDGAHQMDQHFEEAPWPENIPMMLALLGFWYHNFYGAETHAVLPYDHWLRLLPAHLQQLDMESNGKSVTSHGGPVTWSTGPVVWGGEGTNGQHAFHQLLHQGTRFVSVDFILPLTPAHRRREHHDWLVANCFAQSQALMDGRPNPPDPARNHRVMPGNRPSNMIMVDKVTPETVGALVAMYEHKVFCQAMLWHINPFDQWGVELGKELGSVIHAAIADDNIDASIDHTTRIQIERYKAKLSRRGS